MSTPEAPRQLAEFSNEDGFRFEGRSSSSSGIRDQIKILDLNNARRGVRSLKEWALFRLAPESGHRALDIGAGTGEDTVALAERVGPGGSATGVEPANGLRKEARRRAGDRHPGVEFVDGDTRTLPYGEGHFDVIRCERVLQHIANPEEAVREMVRVLRPGGRIVLIDTDWSTSTLHPGRPDLVRRVLGALSAPLANPESGRQLRGLLVRAGIEISDVHASTWIDDGDAGLRGTAAAIPERALKAGAITREEADQLSREFSESSRAGTFFRSTTMFAVCGVRRT
ncbi:methyltransferase domain-containing protein [Nocardiopsis salina]|uniref:methyltransferase domain-containing protein n=1 Tax=Nocardiopsis salina TaxID=245836 RepID=UPI00036DF003|nr:methyltransferase domain-containing protein [Nocardiopsis salina]